jgi:hypothetical protein
MIENKTREEEDHYHYNNTNLTFIATARLVVDKGNPFDHNTRKT